MADEMRPKLRRVQARPDHQHGQPVVVLSDPMRLSENAVALPQQVMPLLELFDGTRDLATLGTAFELRTGVKVGPEYLDSLVSALDEALLLESEHFEQTYRDAVEKFRTAPSRPSTMMDATYQENPELMERVLEEHFDRLPDEGEKPRAISEVRGLVSPHIDYQRGGPVYAQVWRRVAEAVRDTEIALVLGTNHCSGQGLITLTRQSYSTPWGIMPTAVEVVDAVASALGEDAVFADELNHRSEHSVEASAVWLHYLARGGACQLVPILCGSFQRFIEEGRRPGDDDEIFRFVDSVRESTAGRRTLIVASGDLAHVGPEFGDRHPMGVAERSELSNADGELMDLIAAGDAEGAFRRVQEDGDRWRICGISPIYLALRILGDARGEITGYAQCPADHEGASFVSICGIALG